MISLIIKIVVAIVIWFLVYLYLKKRKEFNILKNSLDQRQKKTSETLSILKMQYEKFIQSKDERIEKLEKELEESKSKNKVLQSGESLLTSINEYKERDASSGKYKKGKLIYAVMKTLINTKAELSVKELAEMLGTSPACVRKSLNHLIETRDVKRQRYGKIYKYRLAEWVSIEYS